MPTKSRKANITLNIVKTLKPGDQVRDNQISGFGVRLQKAGGKPSYFVNRRIKDGATVSITIGPHGTWTPATARDKALEICHQLNQGINPNQERKAERNKLTFDQASKRFLTEHGPKLKPRTYYDYDRMLTKLILPVFAKKNLDEVSHTDLIRFHVKMKNTPRQANHCLSVISKLMSWAQQSGLRSDSINPVIGIKRFKENKKERYLSMDEFKALGDLLIQLEADGSESSFVIAALRLYLFTGARRGEILELKWKHVDLDAGVLRLPDSKTGQKTIHLNVAAIEVLNNIPRLSGNPYVIVGKKEGSHLVNITKPWMRIRTLIGLDDVRLHDLRHSFASVIASSGGSLIMIGKLLGHTQPTTTARYAHLFDAPLRELNERAGDAIANAMNQSLNS